MIGNAGVPRGSRYLIIRDLGLYDCVKKSGWDLVLNNNVSGPDGVGGWLTTAGACYMGVVQSWGGYVYTHVYYVLLVMICISMIITRITYRYIYIYTCSHTYICIYVCI